MGKIYDALEKLNREKQKKAKRPNVDFGPKGQERAEFMGPPPVKQSREFHNYATGAVIPENTLDNRLIVLSDPNCLAAEQFKILRSRIFHPQTGTSPRSLMVASALLEEGKSIIAANLAVSIAQEIKRHVILVDTDMRKPLQHALFNVPGERGLSDYLGEDIPLSGLLLNTGVERLKLLPGGPAPSNPSELLSSEKMSRLMVELQTRYQDRVVIYDATPVQIAAETSVLAKNVDGIVLVVRRGQSNRDVIERALTVLGREKVVGIVFNCFTHLGREYESYKSFGYNE